jgi:formamidopyrimidine-DNA glycosylase
MLFPKREFATEAALISHKPLTRIEAVGKNLFYFFGSKELPRQVVHIHFGMSGRFRVHSQSQAPAVTPTARLQLVSLEEAESEPLVAHCSAMTCRLEDEGYFAAKLLTLGPDPLREDADAERLWQSCKTTRKSVGQVLMDQSLVAGVGNILRHLQARRASLRALSWPGINNRVPNKEELCGLGGL